MGIKGKLDIRYWVLPYNLNKAKEHFKQVKPMLRALEYWLGAYPFYEDGYQLVESPHLGMEHQSAIAYGNKFLNGYMGKDRSGNTGWGLKWDFIIVHESGHEWFANNITAKDIADMWIHESFTTYSETLFVEYYYGKAAANTYNFGQRKNILNDKPIIGPYGVNKEGSSDMYDKGSNMIHTLRHALNNDSLFRQMLIKLNSTFYHSTVTTQEIENFIINTTHYNWQPVFNQYLRTTQIPVLVYHYNSGNKNLSLTFENCVPNFTLPIWLEGKRIEVSNTQTAQIYFSTENVELAVKELEKLYYIQVKRQ
jgi:aminopeptidase N